MDKLSHPLCNVTGYYLSIRKHQRFNLWSLEMDKQFRPTLYWACFLSMLGLKLICVRYRPQDSYVANTVPTDGLSVRIHLQTWYRLYSQKCFLPGFSCYEWFLVITPMTRWHSLIGRRLFFRSFGHFQLRKHYIIYVGVGEINFQIYPHSPI